MKVLHVTMGLDRNAGGPARSVQGLVAAERSAGVDAWVWSLNGSKPWVAGVKSLNGATPRVKEFDLVHIHGIWCRKLHRVAILCREAGVPYIISPRGMLEPWSLRQKWFKKFLARLIYQDHDLNCAAALHATAGSEAGQFRKLGFKNRIIISPNGVNLPNRVLEPKVKGDGERRRALFVSRMHPKKGVVELVESWARVKSEMENAGGDREWCCELVYTMNGDEERAYEQKVKQRILELGMAYQDQDGTINSMTTTPNYDFLFTGSLDDDAKWDAYARADLFVLPTSSENFGIVVAEALWASVPVITTKGTPWKDLEDFKCGWWIDLPSAEVRDKGRGLQWTSLDSALREAFEQSNNRTILQEMGRCGHQLVSERYTWAAVCDKMVRGYEGVLNGRA